MNLGYLAIPVSEYLPELLMPKKRKNIMTRFVGNVACPSCQFVMYRNEDGTVQCGMNDCELYRKRFNLPLIALIPAS